MFRVVQDQLKVSEGWVRCGRCESVFNAQENLFDLEHDAPPPWQPPEASSTPEPLPEEDHDQATEVAPTAEDTDPSIESTALRADPTAWDSSAPALTAETDTPIADNTNAGPVFAEAVLAPPGEPHDTAPTIDATGHAAALSAPADEVLGENITPEFLRQAQRKERWQQPAVRWLLGTLVLVSMLLLTGQAIRHYRQVIAAQHPSTVPWLERFCAIAQCRIGTLQRIADVSIETTALTQVAEPAATADDAASAPAEAHLLRLGITLRNRGEWPIAMPDVDLSLTGSDGELIARRSLSPQDFGVADPQLLPGQDLPLSLRFRVASGRVSGYTVEVFYP